MSAFFKRIFSPRTNPGIRLIVFDFDGTIADTRGLLLNIVSKHLMKFNISLTKELLLEFGNAPMHDFLTISGIRRDLTEVVTNSIHDDFMKEYKKIKLCNGVRTISKINVPKVIVSNNVSSFVNESIKFLKTNYFDSVHGTDQFKNKAIAIRELAKKYNVSPNEVIYVGDRAIDVTVAREVGCYSVVISNKTSWSTHKELTMAQPDYLLTSIAKLPKVISLINQSQFHTV